MTGIRHSLLPAPLHTVITVSEEPTLIQKGQHLSIFPRSTIPSYGQYVELRVEVIASSDSSFSTGVKVGGQGAMPISMTVAPIPNATSLNILKK